jgi:hypothetical protein
VGCKGRQGEKHALQRLVALGQEPVLVPVLALAQALVQALALVLALALFCGWRRNVQCLCLPFQTKWI